MERLTEFWQYSAAALVLLALLKLRSAMIKRKKRLQRDFDRKLETVLQPRENVKAVCRDKNGHWVLTSRRLLMETKEGFLALPFARIKRVQGQDAAGKTTASVPKMASLTVKAEKEYTLHNTSEDFAELARQLKAKARKKKKP